GSIGVFIVFPKIEELLNDKLGIHIDTVTTNRYSAAFTPFFPSTPGEQAILQSEVDQIYETFLERVSEARNMTRDEVNEVAQGRVWTGKQAIEKGLVDEMGDLQHTIALAAERAGISEYRTVSYPRIKDPIYQFLEELTGQDFNATIELFRSNPTDAIRTKLEKQLKSWTRPMARIPVDIIWE